LKTLGVVIAGGASTRYGSPKLLAEVGGVRIVDRVAAALGEVCTERVAIVNDPDIARSVGLDWRPDAVAGGGAVAGLLTAVRWAVERGAEAILAVGADMPFVPPTLLRALAAALEATDADAVLPASGGRRGLEPLCAAYRVRCEPAIAAALARGDRRMIGFHAAIRVEQLAAHDVRRHGDPDRIFFNVNTPADRELADRMAAEP
jgi:molybdopterin-guanine dinucleotide biosynthesis protein A